MSNFTGSILEQNYNLTKLITTGSTSAIDDPPLWIANWNILMQNMGLVTFLYVLGTILFLWVRRRPEVKDSEALLYAGLSTTVIGIIFFAIDIVALPGYKLITWGQLLPVIVITAGAIFMNFINRNY